jgi:NTE family protein
MWDLAGRLVQARKFEDLRIPLTVVCTDLQLGSSVRFGRGELLPPVVGSCLAAGVFAPVQYQGRDLVDGGYSDPVPISAAGDDGIVVVVDPSSVPNWDVRVSHSSSWRNVVKVGTVAEQFRKSIDTLIYSLGRERLRQHDHILIAPDLGSMTFLEFDRARFAIEMGYESTSAAVPRIKDQLNTESTKAVSSLS